MREINFLTKYQKATQRDYVARVVEHDKAECAVVAKQWGHDYWDGERQFGYGGYRYDGRWRPIAQDIVAYYGLTAGMRVLDIGCGKAFLLYELAQLVPGLEVAGIDISEYAIAHAKEEVRPYLRVGDACQLPYQDHSVDLILSLNTLHNLAIADLQKTIREIERVGRDKKWLCMESFRNEKEKANLLYWQITCMSFYDTDSWKWLLNSFGYRGDIGFIFFE